MCKINKTRSPQVVLEKLSSIERCTAYTGFFFDTFTANAYNIIAGKLS